MAHDAPDTDADDNVDERARDLSGASRGRGSGGRLIAGAAVLAVTGVAAFALLAPDQFAQLLGLGTSDVEEMQVPARPPNIMTEFTTRPEQTLDTDFAFPEAQATPTMPAVPRREPLMETAAAPTLDVSRVEELLEQLVDREPGGRGLSGQEVESMMDDLATRFEQDMQRQLADQRRDFDRQLARERQEADARIASLEAERLARLDAQQRAEEERLRQLAVRQEQLRSPLLVYDGTAEPALASGSGPAGGASRQLNENEQFLAQAANTSVVTARSNTIADPSRTIVQGTMLEVVLETAISTDLPGAIRAVLHYDVRSYDGSRVLLPQGTRVIGEYRSDVAIAQRRALIAWTRAVTPDGTSIMLGSVGTDRLGRSGATGQVNTRFLERFGSAALISIIGAAPALLLDDDNGDDDDLAEDVGRDFERGADTALDAYLRLEPIISIQQGEVMNVFVNRDLVFES